MLLQVNHKTIFDMNIRSKMTPGNNWCGMDLDTTSSSSALAPSSSSSLPLWVNPSVHSHRSTTDTNSTITGPLHHACQLSQNFRSNLILTNNHHDSDHEANINDDSGLTLLAPPTKRMKLHHNDHQVLIWETIPLSSNHHDEPRQFFLIRPDQSLLELFRMEYPKSNEPDWWQILELTSQTYYHSNSFHLPVSQLLEDA